MASLNIDEVFKLLPKNPPTTAIALGGLIISLGIICDFEELIPSGSIFFWIGCYYKFSDYFLPIYLFSVI